MHSLVPLFTRKYQKLCVGRIDFGVRDKLQSVRTRAKDGNISRWTVRLVIPWGLSTFGFATFSADPASFLVTSMPSLSPLQAGSPMVMTDAVLMHHHCFLHRKRWAKFSPTPFPWDSCKNRWCSGLFLLLWVGFFVPSTPRYILIRWSHVGCWSAGQRGGPPPRSHCLSFGRGYFDTLIRFFIASVVFLQQLWQSSQTWNRIKYFAIMP